MFTGIIEALGKVVSVEKERENLHLSISSPISHSLKIDQSLAHNGVCLTVVGLDPTLGIHTVTAVQETLGKTNLGSLKEGDAVNLERSLIAGERLDGHIVQGHVDTCAICKKMEDRKGSWLFSFEYQKKPGHLTVEKGSVCINGVSLTVVDSGMDSFSVAIIPYTYGFTNFSLLRPGDPVNIEFDIVGKYISKILLLRN
jgi:riboflavin synthase